MPNVAFSHTVTPFQFYLSRLPTNSQPLHPSVNPRCLSFLRWSPPPLSSHTPLVLSIHSHPPYPWSVPSFHFLPMYVFPLLLTSSYFLCHLCRLRFPLSLAPATDSSRTLREPILNLCTSSLSPKQLSIAPRLKRSPTKRLTRTPVREEAALCPCGRRGSGRGGGAWLYRTGMSTGIGSANVRRASAYTRM